jgi:hypothetical protein
MYIFSNQASKSHHHRSRSPPIYRSSPPLKRSRYQRERSRSIEKNGHRRGPTPTDIRRKNPVSKLYVYNNNNKKKVEKLFVL